MELYILAENIPQNILGVISSSMKNFNKVEYINDRCLVIESASDDGIIENLVSYLITETKIHYMRTESREKHTKIEITTDYENLTKYVENISDLLQKQEYTEEETELDDDNINEEEIESEQLEENLVNSVESEFEFDEGNDDVTKEITEASKLESKSENHVKKKKRKSKKKEENNLEYLECITKNIDVSDVIFTTPFISKKVESLFNKMTENIELGEVEKKFLLTFFKCAASSEKDIDFEEIYIDALWKRHPCIIESGTTRILCQKIIEAFCNEEMEVEIFLEKLRKIVHLEKEDFPMGTEASEKV